jgi:hypothetical protein
MLSLSSKRALFLCGGNVTAISSPLPFCGVGTPAVAVAEILGLGPFWVSFPFAFVPLVEGDIGLLGPFGGAFAFAFVPLEEGEEVFLEVVRCDFFFRSDSSSLPSAAGLRRDTLVILQLWAHSCVLRRELRMPPKRGVILWVCNE